MITSQEAKELLQVEGKEFWDLLHEANKIRVKNWGNKVILCAIMNAKSGACKENCKFCAQSVHNSAEIEIYPLIKSEEMIERAKSGVKTGAKMIGIVTSGDKINKRKDIDEINNAINVIDKELSISPCASLGIVDKETVVELKNAGLKRYHHNIESAPSFYPYICSTHKFEDSIKTITAIKEAGLQLCCGGIFGMGESIAQQVELLETVKQLGADSVPINFLNPITGTPLEKQDKLTPIHCLRILAVARILMPDKEIRTCGGREYNLRKLQCLIFYAGANGMMIGGYLTTQGNNSEDDLQMLKDLELDF